MSIPETKNCEDAFKRVVDEIKGLGIICYSSKYLNQLTSNFSIPSIGNGGYGVVYRGRVPSGCEQVAIKKLINKDIVEESETFMAEVRTMSITSHRNLIKLKGYCFEPSLKALVYEFMEKGSLDNILYKSDTSMKWEQFYSIAVEIANGLRYLHEESNEQIIHYDIKAGNVLLDNNFCPKIADFGLAKLIKRDVSGVPLSGMRGTQGYTAPELYTHGFSSKVTNKCDVYSFGMLLFEILGKRNINKKEVGVFFPVQVWNSFDSGQLVHLLDNIGITKENRENAIILSKVALMCIQQHPEDRPTMMEVWLMLRNDKQVQRKPDIPSLLWGRPSASSMTSSKSKYQLSDDDFNGTSSGSNARSNQDPKSISSSLKDTTHGSTASVVHQPSTMEEGTWEKITLENGAIYEGTLKNGLPHGKGKMVWTNGKTYDGEWKNGFQEGNGKDQYKHGEYYEGTFKNGVREGRGKYVYDGNEYVGEFKNGMFEGQGKYVYKNGNEYVGKFKYGLFEGQGKFIYKDENEYVGEFKNGMFEGKGKFVWVNGKMYIGEYRNNLYDGKGKLRLENGDEYAGEFKDGKFEGHGKFIYENGSYHEGTYKNDLKDGKGKFVSAHEKEYHGEWIKGIRQDNEEIHYNSICVKNDDEAANQSTHNDRSNQWNTSFTMEEGLKGTWKKFTYEDGSVYEGTWKNGLLHGKGRMLWTNGNKYVGEWKDDFPDGSGKLQYENGDYYEGTFKKGLREGCGKLVFVNEEVYIGEFRKGFREGHGKFSYANGNEYIGDVRKGKPDGHGKFIYKNGSYHEGTFKNGLKDGKGRFVNANGEELQLGEWKEGNLLFPDLL